MAERSILKELSRYPLGTYAEIIYRNALLHPEKTAFQYGKETVSFARFNQRVNSLVRGLQALGLKKGDVIGVLSWNCLECIDVFGAAMKGGFITAPFNPRLHVDELDCLINDSGAKALFAGSELAQQIDRLKARLKNMAHYIALEGRTEGMVPHSEFLSFSGEEPAVEVKESDPFIIFYTSGTSGIPRGALYSHTRKLEEAKNKALQVGLKPHHKHILVLPLFHIGGWSHTWAFFCIGASNIIMTQRSFDPEAVLRTIQDEKATDIDIVPTHLVSMLAVPGFEAYDLKSLERMWYAASPMPTELLRKGIAAFGEVFAQGYGQSESGPDIAILTREAHRVLDRPLAEQKVLSSCGQPCMGVHVRILDKGNKDLGPRALGEIAVSSKWIMLGYWNNPEETARTIVDGWLHTGDMGYYDEKGFLYIVDRKKDMIITGGENVYPRQVEEVLYTHPAIQEAAVIGVPDDKWVERVHAVVTLKPGEKVGADQVIAFCRARLAGYQTPKSVEFSESLPKNPQGKILKKVLWERWRKDPDPRGGNGWATVIRECTDADFDAILEVINDGAQAYEGVIPEDRWHDPYMSPEALMRELDDGVLFWGCEEGGGLAGVMGIQDRGDVTLIRHAYVRTSRRNRGIGGRLLRFLEGMTSKPMLIGTWAAATWAIAFYEKKGYRLLPKDEKNRLLKRYWTIPERQVETSVVLADSRWKSL